MATKDKQQFIMKSILTILCTAITLISFGQDTSTEVKHKGFSFSLTGGVSIPTGKFAGKTRAEWWLHEDLKDAEVGYRFNVNINYNFNRYFGIGIAYSQIQNKASYFDNRPYFIGDFDSFTKKTFTQDQFLLGIIGTIPITDRININLRPMGGYTAGLIMGHKSETILMVNIGTDFEYHVTNQFSILGLIDYNYSQHSTRSHSWYYNHNPYVTVFTVQTGIAYKL